MTAVDWLHALSLGALLLALFGDCLHTVRRALWRLLPWRRRRSPFRCGDCGARLTMSEAAYYGNSCERCEGYYR